MRTIQVWHNVAAFIAACAISFSVAAQPDSDTPPQLQPLEEVGPAAPASSTAPPVREIGEKRAPGGKVTEIRVTRGNNTYYLTPNDSRSADGNRVRGAQWEILQFDFRPNKAQETETTENVPAPPPPEIAD